MIRALALVIAVAVTALLAAPSAALAATDQQIYKDAADGSLDGTYTVAEIRHADANVPTQTREYTLWDDIVADYLRRLRNPDEPKVPTVPVRDYDGDGEVTTKDVAIAKDKTDKARAAALAKARAAAAAKQAAAAAQAAAGDDESEAGDDEAGDDTDSDDGTSAGLIALLIALPLLVIGAGVWRMLAARKRGPVDPADPADEHTDLPPFGE